MDDPLKLASFRTRPHLLRIGFVPSDANAGLPAFPFRDRAIPRAGFGFVLFCPSPLFPAAQRQKMGSFRNFRGGASCHHHRLRIGFVSSHRPPPPGPVHLPPSSAGGWVPVLYNELVRQGQTQGDLAPARFHFYDHQNSSTPTRKHASPATAAVDRQRQIGFVSHRRPDRLPGPQIGFVPSYSSTAPLASHPQPSHPAGRVWVRSNHSNSLVPSGSTSELGSFRHVPKPRYTPPRHPQIGFVPSKSCPTPELPVLPLLPQ